MRETVIGQRHRHRPEQFDPDCWECGKRLATCKKKRDYLTFDEAQEAADDLNVRQNWKRSALPYRCRWCTCFHVCTAINASQRRRVRKRRVRHLMTLVKPVSNPMILIRTPEKIYLPGEDHPTYLEGSVSDGD